MKHLITGESISQNSKENIREIITSNKAVVELTSLKIVSIGTNSYLALISIDYYDNLTDTEIVNLNKKIMKDIQDLDSSVSEIYFNPK